MAIETDLEVVQGETKVFSVIWNVGEDPHSLDGYAAHMQVRRRPGKFTTAPILDLSSEGEDAELEIEPNDTTGEVKVRIPAAQTAILTKVCWYSLFVINKSDPTEAVRLAFGKLTPSLSSTDNSELTFEMQSLDLSRPAAQGRLAELEARVAALEGTAG